MPPLKGSYHTFGRVNQTMQANIANLNDISASKVVQANIALI